MNTLKALQVARSGGTPLFVYDSAVIREKLSLLRGSMPVGFRILYAAKANPNPDVLRFFKRLGVGLDIASGGELESAIRAGFRAASMSFAGPGKTTEELELAVRVEVGIINLESFAELDLLESIARKRRKRVRIGVRVNPALVAGRAGMTMGSGPKPFGIDEEEIPRFLAEVKRKKGVILHGVHSFPSSQVLDDEVILANFKNGLRVAAEIEKMHGEPLRVVNIGGGFGIPYFKNETEFDIQRLGTGFEKLMRTVRTHFKKARFFVESGRYLVGDSGIYLTKVLYRKVSRGVTYLITDGGMNHHLAASGNFGTVIRRNFDVRNVTRMDEPTTEQVNVSGPLCTPLDVLAENLALPKTEPGDILGIFNSGAYAFSASPLRFLSHPLPEERLI